MALIVLGLAPPGAAAPTDHDDPVPRVPPGFAVATYQAVGGLATSLDFGPDTRDPSVERLYVADHTNGRIVAIDDIGGAGANPVVFASGFRNPLGVLVGDDGAVFVADAEAPRAGPFGTRSYGRVWRVRDTDGDGAADEQEVVLQDLPNGRHNTNGMAFGPDGMLYVANGNSTDDGVEGGQPEVKPWSGSVVRVDPTATEVSLAKLPVRSALVAHGMRNLYDIAFSPRDASRLLIAMNGLDDAREGSTGENPVEELEDSDDLLYATDIADRRVDDFGFPSCLYNLARRGDLEPYDSPNPQTIARFGPCPKKVPRPLATFGLHVSADGVAFQTTEAWGPSFKNDLFVAEFGNFFGAEPVGHKVVHVEFDAAGKRVVRQSEFLSGAAPLDVTFDGAGDMYVADFSGVIYKVTKVVDVPTVVEVQMNGYQFLPAVLTVPEGTVIRWVNRETLGLIHNVRGQLAIRSTRVVDDAQEMNSPTDLAVGSSHEFRFDVPGTWVYNCSINATHAALMHGVITVVPAGS